MKPKAVPHEPLRTSFKGPRRLPGCLWGTDAREILLACVKCHRPAQGHTSPRRAVLTSSGSTVGKGAGLNSPSRVCVLCGGHRNPPSVEVSKDMSNEALVQSYTLSALIAEFLSDEPWARRGLPEGPGEGEKYGEKLRNLVAPVWC